MIHPVKQYKGLRRLLVLYTDVGCVERMCELWNTRGYTWRGVSTACDDGQYSGKDVGDEVTCGSVSTSCAGRSYSARILHIGRHQRHVKGRVDHAGGRSATSEGRRLCNRARRSVRKLSGRSISSRRGQMLCCGGRHAGLLPPGWRGHAS